MGGALAAAWFAEIGIIATRDLAQKKRPPLPSELLASFVVFGVALGALSIPAPKAAGLIGWGLVLSTLLSSKVDILKPVGDFLGGGYSGLGTAGPSLGPAPPGQDYGLGPGVRPPSTA